MTAEQTRDNESRAEFNDFIYSKAGSRLGSNSALRDAAWVAWDELWNRTESELTELRAVEAYGTEMLHRITRAISTITNVEYGEHGPETDPWEAAITHLERLARFAKGARFLRHRAEEEEYL